jgi:putative membrane protein
MVGIGIMMVGMALFWGAIILGIVWLIAWSIRCADRGRSMQEEELASGESPTEILERRFAEGDVSVEDYRKRREVLIEVSGAVQSNGAHEYEPLATPRAREGRR